MDIAGGAQPLGYKAWRDKLRGDKEFRKLQENASRFATEFVKDQTKGSCVM
jgi:hypothetical protein